MSNKRNPALAKQRRIGKLRRRQKRQDRQSVIITSVVWQNDVRIVSRVKVRRELAVDHIIGKHPASASVGHINSQAELDELYHKNVLADQNDIKFRATVLEMHKRTDLSLMKCKKFLLEADGDIDKAIKLARDDLTKNSPWKPW